MREGQGTVGGKEKELELGKDKEQFVRAGEEQWERMTRSSVKEGYGIVGAKDKEQCEGGTRNSWRDGKGTDEWRDKEQCEGKSRNRGVEGQGAMHGRKGQGTFGGMEKNWKRKGQGTM